jgi:small subunit ribosomal protein S3
MGRQTSPNILRISAILRSWDGKWFTDRRANYRKSLKGDLLIRRYFDKELRGASVSRIEIARDQQEIVLTIHTSRPAVLIGRGGSGIEKIQKDLLKILKEKQRLRVNVQEVRNSDTDPVAIATQVAEQIERRMPYRRVLKQAVARSMQAGALGVKVALAGRLNGSEIARNEWLADGNVPLHTFRSDIAYALKTAFTTYGTIGVKVWVNRGELVVGEEEELGQARQARQRAPRRKKGQSSLAERAKQQRERKVS